MVPARHLPSPPILIITDRQQARRPLADIATAAFEAGARWISIREKDLPFQDQAARANMMAEMAPPDARVCLHGEPQQDGGPLANWHLPKNGSVEGARATAGETGLIGISCHGIDAVESARKAGADYVTLSPIFPTRSKTGYGPALGSKTLQTVCGSEPISIVALGGITPETLAICRKAGAAGVAVMGEVMRADDPGAAVSALIEAWNRAD